MMVDFGMKGIRIERLGLRLAWLLVLLGLLSVSYGQDYPFYKGDTVRTGKSTSFLTNGPGLGLLTWFHPNASDSAGRTQLVDNLMRPTTTDPAYTSATGAWFGPGDITTEATTPYIPTDINVPQAGVTYSIPVSNASSASPIVITTTTNHNLFTGDIVNITGVSGNTAADGHFTITVLSTTTFSLNGSTSNGTYSGGGSVQDVSDYQYAECIASDTSGNPESPLNPTDTLSVFSWALRNTVTPFYEAHNYAIYAYLPSGPTTVGGVQEFPQRYYVYEIDYAGGSKVDIVDTNIASGGWIRLGNGGAPTETTFASDGINPITVKLLNTVPRDSSGVLTTDPSSSGNDLDPSARPIVYADAVKAVPDVGDYVASPVVSSFTGMAGLTIRTIAALNKHNVGTLNGQSVTTEEGVVTSYDYNTGIVKWTMSPLQNSTLSFELDNDSSGVVQTGSAFTVDTTANNYRGNNYLSAATVSVLGTESTVEYTPNINPESYQIYAWIPGDSNGEAFAQHLQYEIFEGSTETDVTVDQSGTTAKGWVQIGTRAFLNGGSAAPLKVVVTNYSADPGDATRLAYADAIHFVGPSNLAVNSTPLQTTVMMQMAPPPAPPVAEPVVIVAAENGVIYCLSADGRGDGTTDILWTYPSTRDPDVPLPPPGSPDTWQDPNLNAPTSGHPDWAAIDGTNNTRIAEMPSGFDLTSPVIYNIGGKDYLYIASTNGRIYCIDMAGRGDMDLAHQKPGTTTRVWSYPDDFPANPKPALSIPQGFSFDGSVAVGTNNFGSTATPTVFVPAPEGRIYALNAQGNSGTRTTTTEWTYPAITSPNLGPIEMTPAVDFNQVFFGTFSSDGSQPGQFMALNWDTGAVNWTMATPSQALSDFEGGPCTVDSGSLGGGMPNTVFLSNDNRGLYALDAGTGALQWETYEASGAVEKPLTFTVQDVYDTTGVQTPAEVIVAPENDGEVGLFTALTSDLNISGGRFAGGYVTQSQSLNDSVAVGWRFMYFGDTAGYFYALSTTGGGVTPGEPNPLTPVSSPNNPEAADYTQAGVKMITPTAYAQLRQGTMYYADAIDPSNALARAPMSFEWGETIYLLVYHFPYQKSGLSVPPTINVNFEEDGETVRNFFAASQQFPDISDPNNDSSGYALLQITLQNTGANCLAPGSVQGTVGFNTSDSSGNAINFPAANSQTFFVANPLGLSVPGYGTGASAQTVGDNNNRGDPENLVNGDPSTKLFVLGTEGTLAHGASGNLPVQIVDRSLMELIRGPGRGLSQVRVERNRLAWNGSTVGGAGDALDPLDPTLFPGFEDLPINFPNNSLDYPDITAQSVSVTKSATGNAENPVNYAVDLIAPSTPDGSPLTDDNATTRVLNNTEFDFVVKVPRFQPANEKLGNDQNNPPPGPGSTPAGYTGTYYVFVDSQGTGVLNRGGGLVQTDSQAPAVNRGAFRSFTFGTSVSADRSFEVLTPTVDLGSLAEGVGYTPAPPGPSNALFDPWTTQYSQLFKPFIVANTGNVNLLNLRVAKATTTDNTTDDPWEIFSPSNEDWAYLDGSYDLWSDMDPKFAPMRDVSPDGMVILQKSRVGDRFARQLTTNPVARPNANTGVTADTPRLPTSTYPVQAPRVAVTLPIGFPAGTYVANLKVIDDDVAGSNAAAMWQNLDPTSGAPTEPNSDPGLKVTFRSSEARVTSTFSNLDAPFMDDLVSGSEAFRYGNLQPAGFRDPSHGSLVTAFPSQRPTWAPTTPTSAVTNGQWRIYLGSIAGTDPMSAAGTSPLRDLHGFTPDMTNNRWFLQSPLTTNGFPTSTDDSNIWGGNLVNGTANYGSPVFPANGLEDPYRAISTGMGTPFNNTWMAFVGNARVNNGGQGQDLSQIFVAPVSVDASGAVGIGNIEAMNNDATATKGRPSILQTQNGFVLFYTATVGGRSNIYYTMPSTSGGTGQYDGTYFTDSSALNLGEGFESVSSPYVTGRLYRGANAVNPNGDPIIELTFTGKLHGRPVPEVFYGRIGMDGNLAPTNLINLPVRTRETMFEATEPGTFLADGVEWVTSAPITLEVLENGVYTDIETAGTRQTERDTGIITFDTKLGGKAYLDPIMGTVRLSGAMPPHNAELVLTYQPKLLRISEGTAAGYAAPNLAFDERFIPDITYWRRAGDGSNVDATDPVRTGRYLFTYGRAAAGAGQAARPMLKSMRLGVDLPLPVFTNPDGSTGTITVSSSSGSLNYYQVDPAKKKIYFTPDDEDKQVTINYEAADPATGADLGQRSISASIEMIEERPEELVQLNQATDETNVSMFLDPFDYVNFRRPGLVWMLWSSTRAGAPDIYMQTIAPRFTPVIQGK